MPYTKKLPATRHLLKLARNVGFPTTAGYAIKLAKELELPSELIYFLQTYPTDEIFENRVYFMTRCEELELLIKQEIDLPIESLERDRD